MIHESLRWVDDADERRVEHECERERTRGDDASPDSRAVAR